MLSTIYAISKREIKAYFTAPVAYVFIIIFLMLCGFFTFNVSNFYETGQADLRPFFVWHPWLFLILIPAIAMRVWAEERRSGTIEVLLTLPVTVTQAVMGKFLAAWAIIILALALTFPIILTVGYLGQPDWGPIITGYLGSILLAGAYLAIGNFTSAVTRNQVISFIVAVVICLFLVMAGWPPVTAMVSQWTSPAVTAFIRQLSVMPHFTHMQRGIIDSRDLVYFFSVIVLMLFATTAVLSTRKAS